MVVTMKTPRVDRKGGDQKMGLIEGVSVVTEGEAEGYELWVDRIFLVSVASAINVTAGGMKSRFRHPEANDALGTFLGRLKRGRVEAESVRADLHFDRTSRKTPQGDLADYVIELAESDPRAFGLSLSFTKDVAAEQAFLDRHSTGGVFKSPDRDNKGNYRHLRLEKLRAVDVVDSPAANPEGLFTRKSRVDEPGVLVMLSVAGRSLGLKLQRLEGQSLWEQEWSTQREVQREFRGDKAAYLAFRRAENAGLVNIFGRTRRTG